MTINWAQCHTRPVLMIPGPTELPFPVIQAMNQPPAIQYDRSFDEEVLEPTTLALREVFQTKQEVIIMPGSGRTADAAQLGRAFTRSMNFPIFGKRV